ncbi:hypothetical protein HAX54_012463 [Datura stramonium]|uniref:Uncharacterized protein n=1 Tax=Datura stramonium TaxID=4076 RepID=A0ABS8TJW4_DATST|nr:hypothetical protein [Datura stramonium]
MCMGVYSNFEYGDPDKEAPDGEFKNFSNLDNGKLLVGLYIMKALRGFPPYPSDAIRHPPPPQFRPIHHQGAKENYLEGRHIINGKPQKSITEEKEASTNELESYPNIMDQLKY